MTKDERRNKLYEENRFYLELQHKHGGNFEAMLTPDELTIWNLFPDNHKQLFKSWRDWEWLTKTSLKYFEDNRLIARGVSIRELAWQRLNHYRRLIASCRKFMSLDELADFLFPLVEVKSDYFKQEIIQAICEGTKDPAELRKMDSIDWEQYEVGNYGINIQWLEKQDNEYLRQCALVWRSYLPQTSVETNQITQNKRPSTDDKDQERCEIYQQVVNELGIKTHKGILLKEAANRAVCSEKTMRRAISPKS